MVSVRTHHRCSSHDRTTENLFEPRHMSVLLGCNLWTQLSITSRSSKLDFVLFISVRWNESEYREKWSNSCCLSGSIWDAQQPKLPWAARTCFRPSIIHHFLFCVQSPKAGQVAIFMMLTHTQKKQPYRREALHHLHVLQQTPCSTWISKESFQEISETCLTVQALAIFVRGWSLIFRLVWVQMYGWMSVAADALVSCSDKYPGYCTVSWLLWRTACIFIFYF